MPTGEGEGRLQEGDSTLCARARSPGGCLTASQRFCGPGARRVRKGHDGQGQTWQEGARRIQMLGSERAPGPGEAGLLQHPWG